MSQHTPEPWAYEPGKGHHEGRIVITSREMSASSPLAHISNICDDAEPDARRIVACVNACAGMETPTLENISVKTLAVDLRQANSTIQQMQELLDDYSEDRPALTGMIKQLLEFIDEPPERNCSCHITPPCSDCVEHSHLREVLTSADALLID